MRSGSRSSSAIAARASTLDGVAEDRLGVKRSIIDRMARHGGTATVRSGAGDGTEVRLEIKR